MTSTATHVQPSTAAAPTTVALPSASSVGKALLLLDAFNGPGQVLPLSVLARRSALSKPTAHRLLTQLVEARYVRRTESGYSIDHRMFELGNLAPELRPQGVRAAAMPFLVDLYTRTRETVHLAILDGADVVYLEKLFGHESATVQTFTGGRRRASCTAVGKAMMAFGRDDCLEATLAEGLARLTRQSISSPNVLLSTLSTIRERGYAFDNEESQSGIYCIAAPILDSDGCAVAAISISSRSATVARYHQTLIHSCRNLSAKPGVLGEPVEAATK